MIKKKRVLDEGLNFLCWQRDFTFATTAHSLAVTFSTVSSASSSQPISFTS